MFASLYCKYNLITLLSTGWSGVRCKEWLRFLRVLTLCVQSTMPLQQWLLQSSGSNSVRWLFSFSVLYLYYYYFLFSVSVLEDGFRVNGTDSLCSCPQNHFLIIETCLPCGCAKKHVCEEESGVCPIKRCKRGRYGISVGCVFGRCLLLELFESDTYLLPPGSVLFYYSFQFGLL